jgi:predicted patatin/cPLA2 family phospholipase
MDAIDFIHKPPAGIRITQIAPPRDVSIGRTTRDKAMLRNVYQTGIDYGNSFLKTKT